MSKSNQYTLGEAIQEFLKNYRLEEKITETRIRQAWSKIMGQAIGRYTRRIILKKGELTVYLNSSVLREELSMGKSKIVKLINKEMGSDVIDSITFR